MLCICVCAVPQQPAPALSRSRADYPIESLVRSVNDILIGAAAPGVKSIRQSKEHLIIPNYDVPCRILSHNRPRVEKPLNLHDFTVESTYEAMPQNERNIYEKLKHIEFVCNNSN
jgi:hypothetical protein